MPLDPANFISELLIDDPPGTDPLNQGDDQIRTTKRATQQSFPNIDAAVPQTAAQMAQMAIKNEVNTFTQDQIFSRSIDVNAGIFANNGLASAPSHSFNTETTMGMYKVTTAVLGLAVGSSGVVEIVAGAMKGTDGSAFRPPWSFINNNDMGMYRSSSNVLAFATVGAQRMNLTSTAMQLQQPIHGELGTDAAAAYSFKDRTDTGMSRGTGGALNFAVDGIRRLSLTASQMIVSSNTILAQAGAASAPAYAFESSTDMGFFRNGSGILSASVLGTEVFRFQSDRIKPLKVLFHVDGSAAEPGYTFDATPTMGMYRESASFLAFAVGGVRQARVATNSWQFFQQLLGPLGSAAIPGYSFTGQGSTGMYSLFNNSVSLTAGGVDRFRVQTDRLVIALRTEATRGTTAIPAYTFTAQSNTGMSLPVNNELTFSAGASRQFIVRNNTCAMPLLPTSSAGLNVGDLFRTGSNVNVVT